MAAAFCARIPFSVYAARVILWYRGTMPPGNGRWPAARPPGSLVATSGASFPPGHAVAASVTVLAAVVARLPSLHQTTQDGDGHERAPRTPQYSKGRAT